MNMPPTMGSGIVTKSAPNFPKHPSTIITRPPTWTTLLLPTYINEQRHSGIAEEIKKTWNMNIT